MQLPVLSEMAFYKSREMHFVREIRLTASEICPLRDKLRKKIAVAIFKIFIVFVKVIYTRKLNIK